MMAKGFVVSFGVAWEETITTKQTLFPVWSGDSGYGSGEGGERVPHKGKPPAHLLAASSSFCSGSTFSPLPNISHSNSNHSSSNNNNNNAEPLLTLRATKSVNMCVPVCNRVLCGVLVVLMWCFWVCGE